MKFNTLKLKKWLRQKERDEKHVIDIVSIVHDYEKYNGIEYDDLWNKGVIVLKEWCD